MGVYYNPVEDITNGTVGEFINTHNYDEAIRQLPPKHHLYALCDRLIFKLAVCVDAKEEFEEFFGQYKKRVYDQLPASCVARGRTQAFSLIQV